MFVLGLFWFSLWILFLLDIYNAEYSNQRPMMTEPHACVSYLKQLGLHALTLFGLCADCLGSTVFAPIKADIAGNITVSALQLLDTAQQNAK